MKYTIYFIFHLNNVEKSDRMLEENIIFFVKNVIAKPEQNNIIYNNS